MRVSGDNSHLGAVEFVAKLIAMTAFVRKGERAYILDAGFQACLPKPYTPDKLLETIRTVLND